MPTPSPVQAQPPLSDAAQQDLIEQLSQARDAAEEASRTTNIFMANVSHDLLTPLTVIIGYTEMLLNRSQEYATPEQAVDLAGNLEKVLLSASKLLTIVDGLLDYSRIEAGKLTLWPEVFDVSTLVEEVAEAVRPVIERNENTLVIWVTPDTSQMYADHSRLRQILVNYAENCARFTRHNQIMLEAGMEERNGGEAWVYFRIIDRGMGIPPEYIRNLLQAIIPPDNTAWHKYNNIAPNLLLSQRLCQLMGGEITFDSEARQGSVFTVHLPAKSSLTLTF